MVLLNLEGFNLENPINRQDAKDAKKFKQLKATRRLPLSFPTFTCKPLFCLAALASWRFKCGFEV